MNKEQIKSLIDELMNLAHECSKNAEVAEKDKMPSTSLTCQAMAFAYLNAVSKFQKYLLQQ